MRIHTDTITLDDIHEAARLARVSFETLSEHRSRKRRHAFEVKLLGSSPSRPNSGHRGADSDEYAASWDEWGIFLAHLFSNDPLAVTPYDQSGAFFHWRTGNRFAALRWEDQCRPRHKWGIGHLSYRGYSEATCDKGCGAVTRWTVGNVTFDPDWAGRG